MTFLKEKNLSIALLMLAGALIVFFSTYHLSESPAFWYDEGYHTQASIHIALHGTQALQVAPEEFVSTQYVSSGFPLLYPVALAYKLFGIGVLQGRWVMVIYLLLFGAAAYILAHRLFGRSTAVWSLLLLASLPMLYGIGKSVLGEVPGLFFLALSLLAVWHLERSSYQSLRRYLFAGLTTGLCIVTKPIFLLLLGGFLITYILRRKQIPLLWQGVVLGGAALLLPVALWFMLQFGLHSSAGVVLPFYSNPYAIDNLSQTILQNIVRFFTESTPLYCLLLVSVWMAALAIRVLKRESNSSVETSAFFFCVLIMVAYLRLPGWYRYLFEAIGVSLIFLPASTLTLYNYVQEKFARRIRFLRQLAILPYVVLFILVGLQTYQTAVDSYVAQYYSSTATADLSSAIGSLGSESTFYLYNVPQLAIFLPSQRYYQSLLTYDTVIIGSEELTELQKGTAEYVLVEKDTYQKHPELFARYALYKEVSGYEILSKSI